MKKWLVLSVVLAACVPSSLAQAPGAAAGGKPLEFDVATIKPIEPGGRPTHGIVGVMNHPDGVEADYVGLRSLMQYAYGYKRFPFPDDQITGVPDWAKSQLYDINAKMSAEDIAEFQKLDKDDQAQWQQAMMQALLADRFQLRIHQGAKQAPIYELVVAKGGTKIRDASTDTIPLQKGRDGKPFSGIHETSATTSVVQNYPMKSFADFLSTPAFGIGRPVVDKTGLTGTYNFTLNWSIYARSARPAPEAGAGASDPADEGAFLTTALKEIGLDLHPAMGTLDTIVIDHVERPTEN